MLLLSNHLSARKERRSLFKLPQKAPNQGMGEAAAGMDGEHSRTVHTDGSSRDLPRSCPLLGLWEEELSCVHRWGRPQLQFPALPLAPPCCWQSSPGAENSIVVIPHIYAHSNVTRASPESELIHSQGNVGLPLKSPGCQSIKAWGEMVCNQVTLRSLVCRPGSCTHVTPAASDCSALVMGRWLGLLDALWQ